MIKLRASGYDDFVRVVKQCSGFRRVFSSVGSDPVFRVLAFLDQLTVYVDLSSAPSSLSVDFPETVALDGHVSFV